MGSLGLCHSGYYNAEGAFVPFKYDDDGEQEEDSNEDSDDDDMKTKVMKVIAEILVII